MLSPLMILSLDQGKLTPAPRSVGPFDARLLEDITDCFAEPEVPASAHPRTAGVLAFIRNSLRFRPASPSLSAQLKRLKPRTSVSSAARQPQHG